MAAIVTNQFRINNASNFLGDINDSSNSYYVFVGLSNPGIASAFGRAANNTEWKNNTPSPTDNINYLNHVQDTMVFAKKVSIDNSRRVIRKVTWTKNTKYEMYRHDYSAENPSPVTNSTSLYNANYYVMNKDFNVYVCINNGSSGINSTGNTSQNEPLFTGLEASIATGDNDDGYIWKYLFSVAPSDIIKFDATEYIPVPNDWETNTNSQYKAVRDNGNSDVNNNQLKTVYIQDQGNNYPSNTGQEFNIVGDGSGGKVIVDIINNKVTNVKVSVGGKGYTYGMVDLSSINAGPIQSQTECKLIPIIPPSKGHGYNLYNELGTDRILVYARFDDSTKDFPIDAKFSQIGILKNPTSIGSTTIYTGNQFSSVSSLYLEDFPSATDINVGDVIVQKISPTAEARAYVASFDVISDDESNPIAVVKYYRDRSLYFNQSTGDQTDRSGITTFADSTGEIYDFESSSVPITKIDGTYELGINTSFTGITTNPDGNKIIDLGVEFTNGIAPSEINNNSGDIIYLDNRPLISRDAKQKEDVKVILEF
tara:strand:- start:3251 stop:4867 length:1617 start_codon:yes stop_codon:yes gene_type:complete